MTDRINNIFAMTKAIVDKSKEAFKTNVKSNIENNNNIVLLVEDDYFVYNLLNMIFSSSPAFQLHWVCTAEQALELLHNANYSIKGAICDMNLGNTAGDSNNVIEELIKCNIPTVIYTSFNEYEYKEKIRQEYLNKVIYRHKGALCEIRSLLKLLEDLISGNIVLQDGEIKNA